MFSEKHPNFLYIEQQYGGHLGFYEGGFIYPNSATWLDKNVVNLADALATYTSSVKVTGKVKDYEEEIKISEEELTPDEDKSPVMIRKRMVKKKGPSFVCRRRKALGVQVKVI